MRFRSRLARLVSWEAMISSSVSLLPPQAKEQELGRTQLRQAGRWQASGVVVVAEDQQRLVDESLQELAGAQNA